MNRLQLRIYQPPEEPAERDDEPRDVIPFGRGRTTVISGRLNAPNTRARLIRENSVCPECSCVNVEPVELQDAVISPKNRLPIPGTATIVGFHCNSCGIEWPIYELSTRRNG